jgi:hypothetical protein
MRQGCAEGATNTVLVSEIACICNTQVNEVVTAPELAGSLSYSPAMGPGNAYILELKRRGFDKIQWEPIQEFFKTVEGLD